MIERMEQCETYYFGDRPAKKGKRFLWTAGLSMQIGCTAVFFRERVIFLLGKKRAESVEVRFTFPVKVN